MLMRGGGGNGVDGGQKTEGKRVKTEVNGKDGGDLHIVELI